MNPTRSSSNVSVLGAGLVTLDLIVADLPSRLFWQRAGGTCTNVLAILSHFGVQTAAVARIGLDKAGDVLLQDLKRLGVGCRHVLREERAVTSRIVEIIRPGRTPTHRFQFACPLCHRMLPRNGSPTIELAEKSLAQSPKIDLFFFDRVSPAIIHMAKHVRKSNDLVVFEPAKVGNPEEFKVAISNSDVVKYASQRLRSPIDTLLDSACESPRLVVETLGDRGLRYRIRRADGVLDEWRYQTPFETVTVVDTAGAGDWCTAGFLSRFLAEDPEHRWEEQTVDAALTYGQAVAAASTAFEGPLGYLEVASAQEIQDNAELTLTNGRAFVRDVPRVRTSVSDANDDICPLCLQETLSLKPADVQHQPRDGEVCEQVG